MENRYETIAEMQLHILESFIYDYLQNEDLKSFEEDINAFMEDLDINTDFFEYSRIEDYIKIIEQYFKCIEDGNDKIASMKKAQLLKFYNNV